MERYIDADALKERLEYFSKWCKDGRKQGVDFVLDCPLPDMPTADVAPRAEVAEEIFEEVRNIFNKHYYARYQNKDEYECVAVTNYLSYVAVDFDRLEQKYTGAEPEPPKGEKHDPDPA